MINFCQKCTNWFGKVRSLSLQPYLFVWIISLSNYQSQSAWILFLELVFVLHQTYFLPPVPPWNVFVESNIFCFKFANTYTPIYPFSSSISSSLMMARVLEVVRDKIINTLKRKWQTLTMLIFLWQMIDLYESWRWSWPLYHYGNTLEIPTNEELACKLFV